MYVYVYASAYVNLSVESMHMRLILSFWNMINDLFDSIHISQVRQPFCHFNFLCGIIHMDFQNNIESNDYPKKSEFFLRSKIKNCKWNKSAQNICRSFCNIVKYYMHKNECVSGNLSKIIQVSCVDRCAENRHFATCWTYHMNAPRL